MNAAEIARNIFGGGFILVAPGLAWSYVFFSRGTIDRIARTALSFGLSVVLVPLCVFWLNWLCRVPVNLPSVCLMVAGLTALPAAFPRLGRLYRGSKFSAMFKFGPKR